VLEELLLTKIGGVAGGPCLLGPSLNGGGHVSEEFPQWDLCYGRGTDEGRLARKRVDCLSSLNDRCSRARSGKTEE
jgi:hypothetical protein